MKLKEIFRKWLITKLAGNKLVIINATIIYKYHPIFANTSEDPIIEKSTIIKHDIITPFQVYDSKLFDLTQEELTLKPEHIEVYNNIISEIENSQETTDDKP